jgi:transcriptional regulator with XRE-family HTH domain
VGMSAPNVTLRDARKGLRLTQEELAEAVRAAGCADASKRLVQRWESGEVAAPRPAHARALEKIMRLPITALGFAGAEERYGEGPVDGVTADGILGSVPPSFPVERLAGYWVTSYEFHPGVAHADVAHVQAVSASRVHAVNYPPEPRTEGRAYSFRNEIDAQLVSRHLIGGWRNLSDTRYFGTFQLAVMPGETVMEGFYTGFANDIEVSMARWKWVRLEGELPEMTLREPTEIYQLVMQHSAFDPPLQAADIREES